MAEDSYQDRTEQPTPKRRAEAQEKGQVARSRDLTAALILLTGLGIMTLWSDHLGRNALNIFQRWLHDLRPGVLSSAQLPFLFTQFTLTLAALLAPIFLGLMAASVLANFLQGGWVFAPSRMLPALNRLQFAAGFQRLFSVNSLVELAKSILKVTLTGFVAYLFLKSELPILLPLVHQEAGQIIAHLTSAAFHVSGRILMALAVVGTLDYAYQRVRHEKNLRMTKQEVKDEMRQVEGDPKIKARLRALMRQMAGKRMMAEVPHADVVITNPTHVAVALRYDGAHMVAPQVVAKGQGFVALRIITLARESGVPRVENRHLARALYRQVDVGNTIPTALYLAVAEVLAYVYGLRARAGGTK